MRPSTRTRVARRFRRPSARRTKAHACANAALLCSLVAPVATGGIHAQETARTSITDVPGIQVGHHTLPGRTTGCTVILTLDGATAAVDIRGGAPGTRETALLDPVNTVNEVHAVLLAGGSAFGLDAAGGVVRWLEQRRIGYEVGEHRVPIVVGAILFDLDVGEGRERPDADCGQAAAEAASTHDSAEGNVGAGAGATVGKLRGMARAMKGGVGTASIHRKDGLIVGALVAVNALGDVIDPGTGRVIAGVRTADGDGLVDARLIVRQGPGEHPETGRGEPDSPSSTIIGAVATNARLSKAQLTMVARMAHDGLARAVSPAHTPWDGDTLFALSTGAWAGAGSSTAGARPSVVLAVGALAADAVAEAIVRAIRMAEGIPELPAADDLEGPR